MSYLQGRKLRLLLPELPPTASRCHSSPAVPCCGLSLNFTQKPRQHSKAKTWILSQAVQKIRSCSGITAAMTVVVVETTCPTRGEKRMPSSSSYHGIS